MGGDSWGFVEIFSSGERYFHLAVILRVSLPGDGAYDDPGDGCGSSAEHERQIEATGNAAATFDLGERGAHG